MAINMMCMNSDCKYWWEDNCTRNIDEKRIVIGFDRKCENNSDTELKYLELAGPYKSKKRKYKRLPFIGVILLAMLIIAIIVIIVK